MGELEDKLNSILSSPEEMEKIMGIARSLSMGSSEEQNKKGKSTEPDKSVSDMFGGLDPKMLVRMSRLFGEYSHSSNDKSAILRSVMPYLKPERNRQLNQAAEMAKLARIAKIAFSEFSGGDGNV